MVFKISNAEYKVDNQKILNKLNLHIKKDGHLLIIGPSGSGKTALIYLLAGLLRLSTGEISFEDNNYSLLSNSDLDKLRAINFGFIFQKFHLINHLNVKQNILLAQNKSNLLYVNNLIDDLGLSDKTNKMISELSVGESQRVAIARGIANKPKIIFADEPTSSLDDLNANNVMEIIFSQAKKTNSTVIVSTHDKRIKKYFSNILEMKNE